MFTALLLEQTDEGVAAAVTELDESRLPEGEVLIDVDHSSLNYKDGMILNGIGRLVRDYPHVPGVDLAGTVVESDDPRFAPGDQVICTGWRVGEIWWGGYATKASLKADWLVKVPDTMTARQVMAVGTAGFTAMQALVALEAHGLQPGEPLLVTGASGGVGSSAILWAGLAGHHVVASTGRPENGDELIELGAAEIIDRAELAENPSRPLLTERWAGCIDAVGGDPLAHVLAEMRSGGSVAACGLVAGNALNTTVIPFLLRGVNLLGIDSVMAGLEERQRVWARIAEVMDADKLESLTTEIGLADLPEAADQIMAGKTKGRFVVTPRG
jgi:acrylyl-CoA reductase (NADPH)